MNSIGRKITIFLSLYIIIGILIGLSVGVPNIFLIVLWPLIFALGGMFGGISSSIRGLILATGIIIILMILAYIFDNIFFKKKSKTKKSRRMKTRN